ncbi:MAG: hypothetical protein COV47_00465 [Candidatus Diapherotrites archaeon CG11_big_fil_rev_8_21_14_0_20_37_9]|nr:MAG: hypothetical protein COV47_00465 [Candidatus Diapherotrites archaeon CG11_big_fil_rev_8_21_14_0_20_37_9]
MGSLEKFLGKNSLALLGKIAKGWTSFVYLAENNNGKKFAVKVLRDKANRMDMVKREFENLSLANSVRVGPKLFKADFDNNVIAWEYVDGMVFSDWLFSNPKKKELEKFIALLYYQAEKLDEIGLDHGQLTGRGHNIIVSKGKPVIIDFEKASSKRKVHNKNVIDAFFFRNKNSKVVKKIRGIMSE